MSDLPAGWPETTIGDVSDDISYGFTSSAAQVPNGPKFLRITDIQNGAVDWNTVPFCKVSPKDASKYTLKSGDIVFARTGATTGKSFLIKSCPEAIFASYLIRVRPSNKMLSQFMAYYFQSHYYWEQITDYVSGSAQPNCNATKLSSVRIPLPPLNEQRRIVAKLERLLSRVDAAQARLTKIPLILKRFRKSVLAAACSGQLTVDWREEKSTSQPSTIDNATELPNGWRWSRLTEVATVVDPHPSHRTPPASPSGVPYIGMGDLTEEGRIDFSNARIVSDRIWEEHQQRYRLTEGDFIFGKIGTLGKPFPLSHPFNYVLSANVILIQPHFKIDSSSFCFLYMQTDQLNNLLISETKATSQPAFGIKKVRMLPIPVPPLAEQAEIVIRVKALFNALHSIETRYLKAEAQTAKLQQSILDRAFRGELIPQDPTYEPAADKSK